jgi:surface polysaccharide O-acyltransferase-like enzyme
MMDKTVSATLMAVNLVATIMVIAIHYNSKAFIDISSGYNLNYLLQDFFLNGISRIAVPIFALVSGFIIWDKLTLNNAYVLLLKNRAKTQLLPYVIASFIILVSYNIITYLFKPEDFYPLSITSVFYGTLVSPESPQLWFLRDLMFLVLLSPLLLCKVISIHLILAGLLCILWFLNIQIFPVVGDYYLISIETLFFFSLGGICAYKSIVIKSLINLKGTGKLLVIMTWISLILVRIYIDPSLDVWYVENYSMTSLFLYKLSIIVGIMATFCLCRPLAFNQLVIYLSGLTFFAFLFHLVPLSYFRIFTEKLITKELSFFINFPIALLSVFYVAHFISKKFPKMFAVLSGGRNPSKALMRANTSTND